MREGLLFLRQHLPNDGKKHGMPAGVFDQQAVLKPAQIRQELRFVCEAHALKRG